jgi:hypothetical protein
MEMNAAYSAETVVNNYKTLWYQDSQAHTLNFTAIKTSNLIKRLSNTRVEFIEGRVKGIIRSFIICTRLKYKYKVIKSSRMKHAGNLAERDHLNHPAYMR